MPVPATGQAAHGSALMYAWRVVWTAPSTQGYSATACRMKACASARYPAGGAAHNAARTRHASILRQRAAHVRVVVGISTRAPGECVTIPRITPARLLEGQTAAQRSGGQITYTVPIARAVIMARLAWKRILIQPPTPLQPALQLHVHLVQEAQPAKPKARLAVYGTILLAKTAPSIVQQQ